MSYIEDNGYFVFNGIKSSDYGVWINGGGTFNAPARRVKEYVVPGRNGTLTIDEGVFEDIDHVYSAFIPRDFQKNIETFRNILMANGGYMILEDSYHPDEYYRAKYISGFDVDVAPGGAGGAFELRFRRDPRRFLKTGQEIVQYPYGEKDSPNYLVYPYSDTSHSGANVRWIDNGDGTISTEGYSSTNVGFNLKSLSEHFSLPLGEYVISGCPIGGGADTYYLVVTCYPQGTTIYDFGDGGEFSVTNESHVYEVRIFIKGDANVNGLTFKPMISNKYGENLLRWPYYDGTTRTHYGVTFTATKEEINSSGTNNGTQASQYMIRSKQEYKRTELGENTYKLTGCPQGGGLSTYYIYMGTNAGVVRDFGDGGTLAVEADTRITEAYINIAKNIDASGLTFKPELRLASPAESIPYVPYWNMDTALYNPTNFEAKPLIRVTGSDSNNVINNGVVTINGHDITITEADDKYILIDSETQECYLERVSSMQNDKVSFSDHKFPVLKPGVNSITFSGDIENVQITPRWWIL